MDKDERKKRIDAYRRRVCVGGVYIVRNSVSGRVYLDCTADIAAIENRFAFSKQTHSCVFPRLKNDWDACGPDAFSLEVIETLEKSENQTNEAFTDDLLALKAMKLDEIDPELLY